MEQQSLVAQVGGKSGLVVQALSIVDPYASVDSRRIIDAEVAELTAIALQWHASCGGVKRSNRLRWENPATERMFRSDVHPALRRWRNAHVPSAIALLPLHRPDLRRLADNTPLNDSEIRWMCNLLDAIGTRSRVEILRQLLCEHAYQAATKSPQRWLSLACGGTVGVFEAAREVGKVVDLRLSIADYDLAALEFAGDLATTFYGLRDNVELRKVNILPPSNLMRWIEPHSYDCVEVLGLFEYLQPEKWVYPERAMIRGREQLIGAATMLRNAYAFLRPGGRLIFGNMLPTHPQLDFTLHVVQWPYIQPRSTDEVLTIALAAGLPEGQIRACAGADGVYCVYVVDKPPF